MKLKYKIALTIIGALIIAQVFIGASYALWVQNFEGNKTNTVQSGCFKIDFEELTHSINLKNTYPLSDAQALAKVKPYQIKLSNTCATTDAGYAITLNTVNIAKDRLDDAKIKVAVAENSVKPATGSLLNTMEINQELENIEVENLDTSYIINTGFLETGKTKTFDIYLWVDETAGNEVKNQAFEGAIVVTSYSAKIPEGLENYGINEKVVNEGSGIYKVEHPDSELTEAFSNDLSEAQKNNLKQIEYRYAGANPNNYVTFNNELWRVIGLVNTPEGQRIKIIRNESIGEYSWDSSDSSTNDGYGINEWSQADIMHLLNDGPYYNRTSGICYNAQNNATIDCDFSNSGLSDQAKNMIETITWNTGSNDVATHTYEHINTTEFYSFERSGNTGKVCNSGTYCNDTLTRTTTWKGMIGLMYSSDYGYATSGGTTINRISCLNSELYNWNNSEDCYQNNWLNNSSISQWIISPIADADLAHSSFVVGVNKRVGNGIVAGARGVKPTLFLKSNIKIVDGLGTQENPYQLKA